MVQYALFANGTVTPTNVITGGQCIQSGFFEKRSSVGPTASNQDLINEPSITSDIKGNPDIFCISMVGLADNIDVNANCTWIEIV